MADKKFDQDFTELAAPDTSSRLMISKLDGGIRKTHWITWDKFVGPSITSAAFIGNDIVFTKDDAATVTLTDAKILLKGDQGIQGVKGDTGADGAVGPKGETGAAGANGANGIDGKSFVPKGAYASGTTYIANDVVSYNGSSWIALQATTGNAPSEGVYWTLNAAKGIDGLGSGDMLKSTYDPTNKNADAFSMDNMVETATKKILTDTERTNLGNQSGTNTGDETNTTIKTKLGITTLSGSNTGDQTSIVGITGTIAQFNTALSDADFATGGGTATGTNTGDNATNSQYSGLATSKQDTLVSGTNIKTINSTSILGSGDIVITGGSSSFLATQIFF